MHLRTYSYTKLFDLFHFFLNGKNNMRKYVISGTKKPRKDHYICGDDDDGNADDNNDDEIVVKDEFNYMT